MVWIYFLIGWLVVPVFCYVCHNVLFYIMETDLASLLTLYSYLFPIYGIVVTIYLFVAYGFSIPVVLSFLITTYLVLSSIAVNIHAHNFNQLMNRYMRR